jgi:hypothetical protein
MPLLGFLNELSKPAQDSQRNLVADQLAGLAETVNSARRWRPDFSLQTQTPISSWRFSAAYGFSEFLRDPVTRDKARLLLSTVSRSPLRQGLVMARDVDGDIDFRYEGQQSEALGLANLHDGLVISFNYQDWQHRYLSVERDEIVETTDGNLELLSSTVNVRNACTSVDLEAHRPWLDSAGKNIYANFAEFEAVRFQRLANLDFLSQAIDQLRSLDPSHPWWSAVCKRLDELQEAMVEWRPSKSNEPNWKSFITGEHQRRKLLCNFTDIDGVTRCFDQHARFTPYAGRLHFRIDPTRRRLIVAHIGLKL